MNSIIIKKYNNHLDHYNKFKKKDEINYKFLYASSHYFIIPVIFALYYNRYDIAILSFIIMSTSLLRWGYIHNIYYQNLDHNIVKIIFSFILLSTIIYFLIDIKKKSILSFFNICLAINIIFFFMLGLIADQLYSSYNVVFHLLMHFMCVISMSLSSIYSINVIELFEILRNFRFFLF